MCLILLMLSHQKNLISANIVINLLCNDHYFLYLAFDYCNHSSLSLCTYFQLKQKWIFATNMNKNNILEITDLLLYWLMLEIFNRKALD